MTDLTQAAMQQALEALEDATAYTSCESWSPSMTEECKQVAARLRAALEAPQGEPVAHTSERHFALREAHEHSSTEAYFAARPSFDGPDERKAFRAGFVRGFDAGEKVYAAPQPRPGWVLVPEEPTPEMVEIGAGVIDDNGGNARWADIREAWDAMLAAAPKEPQA